MNKFRPGATLIALFFITSLGFAQTETASNYPFLIPKLDRKPAWIGFALHLDMFLAYDTTSCQLVTAWAPDLLPPAMVGYPYLDKEVSLAQWKIYHNGTPEAAASVKWLGYQLINPDAVVLSYQVQPLNGQLFTVKEIASVITEKMPNRPGLQRTFEVTGGQPDMVLVLPVNVNSLLSGGDLKASGKFLESKKIKKIYEWGDLYDFRGDLGLSTEQQTTLTLYFPIDPEHIVKSVNAVDPISGKPLKPTKPEKEKLLRKAKRRKTNSR